MSNQLAISRRYTCPQHRKRTVVLMAPHYNRGVGVENRTAAPKGLFEWE